MLLTDKDREDAEKYSAKTEPKPENPSAFPYFSPPFNENVVYDYGMSLRDYFAGQVLISKAADYQDKPEHIAQISYEIADAMLKAREEK